jgi:glycosyltransferase involved in cell wall biosynthesis
MAEVTAPERDGIPLGIVELETYGHGGLIHYAYNLSCALAARGHRVTLVTTVSHEFEGRARPGSLAVTPIIARRSRRFGHLLPPLARRWLQKVEVPLDALRVAALVRRLRPDIVHLHSTNHSALAYLLVLRLLAVRVAVTAHVVTAHERSGLDDVIRRGVHRLGHLLIAHSEFDRDRLIGEFSVDPSRVLVAPHGEYGFFAQGSETVDRASARRGLGLASDAEAVLFFGYIRKYKGLDVLLAAWPQIAATRPRARLVIAGDPSLLTPTEFNELQAAAARVGAVCRFGYVPLTDVIQYFTAADVLALPYRRVSQSGVLMLALAVGLPVVATNVGALGELLTDKETALLVPPDSRDELATAVSQALADDQLRARLARSGRLLAERCSWPSIATLTAAAFVKLVARHPEGIRESS